IVRRSRRCVHATSRLRWEDLMSTAISVSNTTMRAAVFHEPGDVRVARVPRPRAGVGQAVIRVTLTTICGTDLHILRGEYRVAKGLILGHEPVGVIEELGAGVEGYNVGQRVL